MMRIEVKPIPFGRWRGMLFIDDEHWKSFDGPRPGCVVRDLLNWMQYNMADPHHEVVLEIQSYE